jgi:hypothetical protein
MNKIAREVYRNTGNYAVGATVTAAGSVERTASCSVCNYIVLFYGSTALLDLGLLILEVSRSQSLRRHTLRRTPLEE